MDVINTENLYKSFDGLAVLRGLSLRVPAGQVYGLLGPNGAGKSTLIHLLLGFLRPNHGTLRVLGTSDLERTRGRIGYLPERLRYHTRYTGREYLRYLGQFNGLSGPSLQARIDEELRTMGLQDAANRMISTYSKGMIQRLGIAQALLMDPELLLIDEPASGLDPAGQREMLDVLVEVRRRGHTILLTTHYMGEVEHLCDRVGILVGGKIAIDLDVTALHNPGRSALIRVAGLSRELAASLMQISPAVRCDQYQLTLHPNSPDLQARVLRALLDADTQIIALEPQGRPLEEIYLQIARGEPVDPALLATQDTLTTQQVEPPNGLFAPPGHPDALPGAEPGRPRSGDTLLRELLKKEDEREP